MKIRLTGSGGEKPKDLSWYNAYNANQWYDMLRIGSPLGGIYLKTSKFKPVLYLTVTDLSGNVTKKESDDVEYYYPHEIPNLKVADLSDIHNKISSIAGDPKTIYEKLNDKYKNLDGIYEVWSTDDLCSPGSQLKYSPNEEELTYLKKYNVTAYGVFMHSVKTFNLFNENLGIRQNVKLMQGGLQLASDFMTQGDVLIIPLKRFVGYQQNAHIIIHFLQGDPDLGRKTFQPELRKLAENIAVAITNTFINYRWIMKPDTGATKVLSPDKELHDWKRMQENWRDSNPISSAAFAESVSYESIPREEQDVISFFNQLIGSGVMKGIHFFGSSYNERYDGLIELNYDSKNKHHYDKDKNPLGVRSDIEIPYTSHPMVIEYKYDFDAILRDIEKEIKFPQHIDLVVCWMAEGKYAKELILKSLLIDNEGNQRTIYGSTHQAYLPGQFVKPVFEVIILQDLYNFFVNKDEELARQKVKYAEENCKN